MTIVGAVPAGSTVSRPGRTNEFSTTSARAREGRTDDRTGLGGKKGSKATSLAAGTRPSNAGGRGYFHSSQPNAVVPNTHHIWPRVAPMIGVRDDQLDDRAFRHVAELVAAKQFLGTRISIRRKRHNIPIAVRSCVATSATSCKPHFVTSARYRQVDERQELLCLVFAYDRHLESY